MIRISYDGSDRSRLLECDMCLAVPMRITSIVGFQCTCEVRGVEREVSLFMLQDQSLKPGDHVLVHVGYAIQKVSEEDALASWELFDQMLAAEGVAGANG